MEHAKPGQKVQFHGLKGDLHLNGTVGSLVKFLERERRWTVRCRCDDQDEVVNAKPENLKIVPSSTPISDVTNEALDCLHNTVLNSFYKRHKGGAIVSCSNKYMLAVECDGPDGNGGIYGEMVFVDKNPQSRAIVQGSKAKGLGSNFLAGETIEYIEESNENIFFGLLSKYQCSSSMQGYVDIKSGLRLWNVSLLPK